ncbi:unnamed protein product, partial [Brachionus calyciflorus]
MTSTLFSLNMLPVIVDIEKLISPTERTQLIIYLTLLYGDSILSLPQLLQYVTFPDGHRLIMDNDRKHTSALTKQWLKKNCINHWPTPAQSPDLNPIELVWHELKTYIRHKKPTTKQSFINSIGEFWSNRMTDEKCSKYISHIFK